MFVPFGEGVLGFGWSYTKNICEFFIYNKYGSYKEDVPSLGPLTKRKANELCPQTVTSRLVAIDISKLAIPPLLGG